jgi:hypothetical protein
MLGFFVSIVISRWQSIFSHIGFIDDPALFVSAYVLGNDEKVILIKYRFIIPFKALNTRRTILRYLCLSQVLVLRDVSVPVKKRFPTMESIINAGYMTKEENDIIQRTNHIYSKYYIPINWVYLILGRFYRKNVINTI